jgi:hypothetical protein
MYKLQWIGPVLLLGSAALAMTAEEEEACTRLQVSLISLLYGSDDERLLVAESAEDAFEDLDEDACSLGVQKVVDRLVEREQDAFLVFRLIEAWAQVEDRARPFLLALERDEPEVRQAAALAIHQGLVELRPEEQEGVLAVWRRERDPRARLLLIDVLGGKTENSRVTEELVAVARSDVPVEAAAALDNLRYLDDPALFLEAWRRPEAEVRDAALRWMTTHVGAGVQDVLLDVAKSGSPGQRSRAVHGLFRISDVRAIQAWREFVIDDEVPHEARRSAVVLAPRTGPWRTAMEELAGTSHRVDETLRAEARRHLDPERIVISCHASSDTHDPPIVGRLDPPPGSDLIPCLARPDRPSAIVRDPLPGGAPVYSFHTWSQGGRRWLGVRPDDPDLDDESLCWIEERRLAPLGPEE